MGPDRSPRYEFAEIEFQNSGFASGEPNSFTNEYRHERGEGVEVAVEPEPLRQRVSRSGYDATTPAQMTPALISLEMTIERSVMYPPIEWPHMPIRFGSASG